MTESLLEQIIQQIRHLSEAEQNEIAQIIIQEIKQKQKIKPSGLVSKLSDELLMPILDSTDYDLFLRDKDTGREISL